MPKNEQFLSRLLECPICFEPFTDPRMLFGCFHTLCCKCLRDHIEHSGRDGCFDCPICKQSVEIPSKVDDFPRNFFASSCLDAVALEFATGDKSQTGKATGTELPTVKAKVCNNSEEGEECAEAVKFCVECCEYFCQLCAKFHRKTTATSKHTQVAVGELTDEMKDEAMSKREIPTCPKHKGETLKLYCSTCQCAVCSICCHIDHQSHTFKEMKDVDEGLKAELGPLVTTVEVLKESVKCQIREVDKTTEVYKKNASKARESVKGLFQQMQQMLSQKAAEIDQEISRKYDEAEAMANSRSKNLVLNGQLLESLSSFAENLKRKGSVFNRLASLPEVRLQVENMKQSLDDMLSAPVVPEVPSHTELFAESVDNLTIKTDIPLDPHNPKEIRKLEVLQTCNIQNEIKRVCGSSPERNIGNTQGSAEGHETQGQRDTESDEIGEWHNVVDVVGIPVGIHRQMVLMLFTSKSESGGGEIKELNYDTNSGRARIRFTHKKDADEVLQRRMIALQDTFVTAQRPTNPSSGAASASKTHPSGSPYPNERNRKEEQLQEQHQGQVTSVADQDNSNDVSQSNVAVLIRGITKKCSPQVLSLFFESKKSSGGGPLVEIDFSPGSDSAIIVFKNSKDAHEVVRRRKFKCEGTLTAEWLQSSTFRNTPVNEPQTGRRPKLCTVQVSGIPSSSSGDYLKLFFGNKRVSGGGPVRRFNYTQGCGTAVVEFEHAEDAERVVQTCPHFFNGALISCGILDTEASYENIVWTET